MKTENVEIETKFVLAGEADLDRVPAALKKIADRVDFAGTVLLHDTYLDTADWALFRSSLACRIRRQSEVEDRAGRPAKAWLVLKELAAPVGRVSTRLELEEPLDRVPDRMIRSLPGDTIRRQLRSTLGSRPIRTLFEIENRRTTYRVKFGPLEADVAADLVLFRAGPRTARLVEVELECVRGDATRLTRLADKLAARLGGQPAQVSKFQTGLHLAAVEPPRLEGLGDLALSADQSARAAAQRVIGLLVAQAHWHEPGTRLGLLSEPLHQMRVTTRRLRAALRIFAEAIGGRASSTLRSDLAELADGLGAVRDLDVYLQDLPAIAQRIGGMDRPAIRLYRQFLIRRRQRARGGLRRMMTSPRYGRLMSRLEQIVRPNEAGADDDAPGANVPVTQFARQVIRLYRSQLLRYARAILAMPSDAQLHRLRLRIKRLRYTCEFLQSLYSDGYLKLPRFIRKLIELQDSLGCFHDAIVQAGMLEAFAAALPDDDPAAESMRHDLGQLVAWQRKRQQRCCRQFFRQWRRYDAKWISRPLKKYIRSA